MQVKFSKPDSVRNALQPWGSRSGVRPPPIAPPQLFTSSQGDFSPRLSAAGTGSTATVSPRVELSGSGGRGGGRESDSDPSEENPSNSIGQDLGIRFTQKIFTIVVVLLWRIVERLACALN